MLNVLLPTLSPVMKILTTFNISILRLRPSAVMDP